MPRKKYFYTIMKPVKCRKRWNKKCFGRSYYKGDVALQNFPIHFLWGSPLSIALWSYRANKWSQASWRAIMSLAIYGNNNTCVFLHHTLHKETHFNKYLSWTVATEQIFCRKTFRVTSVCFFMNTRVSPLPF